MEGEIEKLKQIIIDINGELDRIPGPTIEGRIGCDQCDQLWEELEQVTTDVSQIARNVSDANGYALDYCCECNTAVLKKQSETNTCHVHGIGYIICDDCFQAEV